jgi:hypothetical protein
LLGKASAPGPCLVWVHGPGGIGKTTLLREMRRRLAPAAAPVASISFDRIEPTPHAVLAEAARAFGLEAVAPDLRALLQRGGLLVLDVLEQAAWLEAWLLDELASAPEGGGLVVIGSRDAPSHHWLSPHLADRFVPLELRPFGPGESAAFLQAHDVSAEQQPALCAFTRGHPLALAVVANARAHARPDAHAIAGGGPSEQPEIVRVILDAMVERSLDSRQRAALEAASMVPSLTEGTLAALLGEPDVREQHSWLRSRPYATADRSGLRLHDLVRDVVAADLRWRNPERAALLLARAFDRFSSQLLGATGGEQAHATEALVWMVSQHPNAQTLFRSNQRDLYMDAVRPEDVPAIASLVEGIDGPEARAIWESWFAARPAATVVARNASREVRGARLDLRFRRGDLPARSHDPLIGVLDRFLTSIDLEPEAAISIQRFHLDAATIREPGPTMGLSTALELRSLVSAPRLAIAFFVAPLDTTWAPLWESVGYARCDGHTAQIDGRGFGVWRLDLRRTGPVDYLRAVLSGAPLAPPGPSPRAEASHVESHVDRGPSAAAAGPHRPAQETPLALDEAAFKSAVRAALRGIADPALLAASPLRSTPLVPRQSGADAALALRAVFEREIEGLRPTARGEKWRRALAATYLEPPASQEAIAERLGLPFRTYRDHVTQGLDELVRRLWARARGEL